MRGISKLSRFCRRENRGPWSEVRVRQVRDEAFVNAYRSGLFR